MKMHVIYDEQQAAFFVDNGEISFLNGYAKGLSRTAKRVFEWELLDANGSLIATYREQHKWFGFSREWKVSFTDTTSPTLLHFKAFPPRFELLLHGACYHLTQHQGLYLSLFRNGQQIGELQESSASNAMRIWLNDDVEVTQVSILVYAAIITKADNASAVTVGYVGREYCERNQQWRANATTDIP